jgi:hypothetical protein
MSDRTLAATFRDFARTQRTASALYAELADRVADRADLVALLEQAPRAQRIPVMWFAAVHHAALARDLPFPPTFAELDAFVAAHREAIAHTIATRHVQTNEIGRCAALRAALALLPTEEPITLVDIGASAGLNLMLDRYSYRYVGQSEVSVEDAPEIVCDVSRGAPVPVGPIPAISHRIGVDLMPLDVTDDDDVRWLLACVWADDDARRGRLATAIALARRDPPQMVRAGALDFEIPIGNVVLMHSWVAAYLTENDQRTLLERIRASGATWIYAEEPSWVPGLDTPGGGAEGATALVIQRPGRAAERLADLQPHGRWMRWH